MEKYKDELKVTDLITRKTAAKQYEDNPDFPDQEDWYKCGFWYAHSLFTCHIYICILNTFEYQTLSITGFQELRLYWCWKATTETDRNARLNEVGTSSTGQVDTNTAKNLMSKPEHGCEISWWKRIKNTPLESLYGIFANNIYNKKVYTNTIGMVPPYWGRTLWQPRPRRGICKVQGPRPLGNVSHPTKVEERVVEEKAVEERAAPRRKQPRRQRQLFRKQRKYLDCL